MCHHLDPPQPAVLGLPEPVNYVSDDDDDDYNYYYYYHADDDLDDVS